MPKVVRLQPEDAQRYVAIRLRMLREEPESFGASIDETDTVKAEWIAKLFASDRDATFAIADDAQTLLAVVSVQRVRASKRAHRATIWGLYVAPEQRGRGFARAVMQAAIAHARSWPSVTCIDLGVTAASPAARRLYETLGFNAWGTEPDALNVGDRCIDEVHMTLHVEQHPRTADY